MTSPIPYRIEFAPPSEEQVAKWTTLQPPGERLPTLRGGCPTCGDECQVEVFDVVAVGGARSAVEADEPVVELTRQIICNCRINHGWPDGVRAGCGRYWLGTLTRQADGSYRLSAEQDLTLLPAATALTDEQASQGKRIQGAAEKWLGAVTAIYGLFSLTGVAVAKDSLDGLSTGSKWLVAVVLLLGLAAAATALVFGYQAAYGWPHPVTVDDKPALRQWYQKYQNNAPVAAKQLQMAVFAAFGSLAAVSGVMLLIWFLPRHK
jgi:hypothetical protein